MKLHMYISVFGDVTKFMYFVGQDTQENEINFRKDQA